MSDRAGPLLPLAAEADGPATPYPAGVFRGLFDLGGRAALVVGGGGIGAALAAALADHGARLAVVDLDAEVARRTARSAARAGIPEPLAAQLDITDPARVDAVVGAIEEAAGRIDILVNAAGMIIRRPALGYSPAEWRRVIDVNLSGVFYVTQAVGRGMVGRGYGRVLSLGSVSSLLGHPDHAPYAAAKGGLVLLTKVLATEWAGRGVTVNAIGPTYVETPLNVHELSDPAARAAVIGKIPMGRLGTPEDLVAATVFFCSEAARFVTGQILYIDGGRTAD